MVFYRLIATVLAPIVAMALLWRVLRGQESFGDMRQRLGGRVGHPNAIWIHGASNGELTSARALIAAIATAFPDRPLVVTANSTSGRDMVQGWGIANLHACLAPLDYRISLARFRARWRPAALLMLENELWPNRITTAQEPVFYVAARMSARSARHWQRLSSLMRRVLHHVTWLCAQDDASAARFVALGLVPSRLGPVISLKSGVTLSPPPAEEFARLAQIFNRENTVLAASTHEGEDAPLIAGFAAAQVKKPALRLILAPRHPRRAKEISDIVHAAGLRLAVRSKSESPTAETDVYLVDTLGEMALWYSLAGVTFVGGSLVDKGGHTPFEPAQVNSAVMHGPYVSNFTLAYQSLDQAGAAIKVSSPEDFGNALAALNSTKAQQAMADAAGAVLADIPGPSEGLQQVIAALRSHMAE